MLLEDPYLELQFIFANESNFNNRESQGPYVDWLVLDWFFRKYLRKDLLPWKFKLMKLCFKRFTHNEKLNKWKSYNVLRGIVWNINNVKAEGCYICRKKKEYNLTKLCEDLYKNKWPCPIHDFCHNLDHAIIEKIKKIMRSCKSRMNKKSELFKNEIFCEIFDVSYLGFKNHMESQFTKKMNWDNHFEYWHVDHIIPLSLYDLSLEEDYKNSFKLRNIRPLEKNKNINKSNHISLENIKRLGIEDLLPIKWKERK